MRHSLIKLFFLLLPFLATLVLKVETMAQNVSEKRIQLDFDDTLLPKAIEEIEFKSAYTFFFNASELDTVKITFHGNTTVGEFLNEVFETKALHFVVDPLDNVFISHRPWRIPLADGFFPEKEAGPVRRQGIISYDSMPRISARNNTRGNKLYEIGNKNAYIPGRTVTLSGYIKSNAGAPIDGASVQVEKLKRGAVANQQGYYTITLPAGRHELLVKRVGMEDTRRAVFLYSNGLLDIEMEERVTSLDEITIQADETSQVRNTKLGAEKLNIEEIRNVPTVFGETDIMRVVLTLPGVKSVGEASTGFNVRGGAADQNLILYNDATIYNPSHFFGFFSAFNPEVVKDVELFKSLMPARYGGRLSSVLQVTGKEGDAKKIKGSAGLGLLTSRINLEGPLVKDRTTFVLGARTTYSGWLFSLLPKSSGYKNTKASFYDLNLNLNHKINAHNELALTGYLSHDKSNLNTDTMYYYDNKNLSVKWRHDFSQNFVGSITAGHDHYNYRNLYSKDTVYAYKMKFALNQNVFKAQFLYTPGNKHSIDFGINSTLYRIDPADFGRNHPASLVVPVKVPREQALESAFYIEDQFKVNNRLSLTAGLRYSVYNYLGPQDVRKYPTSVPRQPETITDTISYDKGKVIQTYHGLDYRVSARFSITDNLSIKAGYTTSRQFIHMLSNTIAISPTDTWKLSDSNIKPQISEQISVGIYKNFFSNSVEVSLEGYRKDITNYLDYKSGASLLANPHIETEVFTTQGNAYGLEVMIKKPKGNFNGWMSYTYARTLLKVDDEIAGQTINNGKYYPASHDKPHDFTFVGNQKLSRRFSISMNLTYSSGRPVTIPIGVFDYGGAPKTLYSNRNGYRIPDYFRTDLSLNIEGNHKVHQATHNSWTIGFYNLTGRQNPYSVYFISEKGVIKGYKLSIFGATIPFINYNIRF